MFHAYRQIERAILIDILNVAHMPKRRRMKQTQTLPGSVEG
jgi:hypothetical protein